MLTSPLNYLILIDAIDVLPRLYERVLVPQEVITELMDAPLKVSEWMHQLPEWIEVHPAAQSDDSSLDNLDPGERAAILLSEEKAERLLLLMMPLAGWRRKSGISL